MESVIAQVVSVGGNWGTAARVVNGVTQLVVAFLLWRSVPFTYPRIRAWWAALAGGWATLAVALLAAPLGIIPSTWTPWTVHGVLMVLGPLVVLGHRVAVRVLRGVESDLHDAMKGDS